MTRSEFIRDLRERIANNVRFYRHGLGLTQEELADAVGMSENTIFLLENPRKPYGVPLRVLASVADTFGVTVECLLATREPPPNPRGKPARGFLSRKREAAKHESQRQKV